MIFKVAATNQSGAIGQNHGQVYMQFSFSLKFNAKIIFLQR